MRHYNIPIFVPHLGCHNACVFCNQHVITGEQDAMTADKADNIIQKHLNTIDPQKSDVEIAFFGGSFTGIEVSVQNELLSLAKDYVSHGQVRGIRISTRPDYIDETILRRLKSYGVTAIELGVQSLSNFVLLASNRGHTAQDVEHSAKLIKDFGFSLGLQMMAGMPHSTKEDVFNTAVGISDLQPETVRIYPMIVLRDTRLEEMYRLGIYTPLTVEQTVDICSPVVRLFHERGIRIIRIGLYQDGNVERDVNYVAGPIHPALGELIESRIFRDEITAYLAGAETKGKTLRLTVNPKLVSKIIGQNKENIKYMKLTFEFLKISIIQNTKTQGYTYEILDCGNE